MDGTERCPRHCLQRRAGKRGENRWNRAVGWEMLDVKRWQEEPPPKCTPHPGGSRDGDTALPRGRDTGGARVGLQEPGKGHREHRDAAEGLGKEPGRARSCGCCQILGKAGEGGKQCGKSGLRIPAGSDSRGAVSPSPARAQSPNFGVHSALPIFPSYFSFLSLHSLCNSSRGISPLFCQLLQFGEQPL